MPTSCARFCPLKIYWHAQLSLNNLNKVHGDLAQHFSAMIARLLVGGIERKNISVVSSEVCVDVEDADSIV